ncbi:Maltose/maltodextrin ABC transporter, substrate binding periplasmic protein MalE [Marinobacterium lacunae]|uniref:Maltose/maltodextrin ABC transporter, substrate binding periplasmic protein MalE n=1 Tax=Marinobacterium lacunae TaxID=1232683 RepID=A0A081FTT8_9GAMM|nr:extracellular solute-binding protein [Marinobacterium lacunae]KEA61943.1 Maltose/maltodextrin ABC transporter, substrate binding periplasmic protein MalE [Marinobacterium lacunae]
MYRLLLCLLLAFSSASAFASERLKFIYTHENRNWLPLVEQFSVDTGIEVEVAWAQQGDLKTRMFTYIEQGNAPDIVLVPADHVGLYPLMHYSPLLADMGTDDVGKDVWNSARSDGALYGVPITQGNHLVLYYNKAIISTPATTWADMRRQHDAFRLKDREQPLYFSDWNVDEMYWLMPFLGGFGGSPVTDGEPTLDTPAMARALDFYRGLVESGLADDQCDYNCGQQRFLSGTLGYLINGDWALKEYQERLGDNLGVATIPEIAPGQPVVPMFSTHVLAFPANSLAGHKRDALLAFIHYFQSNDVQLKIWRSLKLLPVSGDAYRVAVSEMNGNEKAMISCLSKSRPMPADSAMSLAWGAIRKGYLRHKLHLLSGEEAAELMQQLVETQRQNVTPAP